MTTWEVRQGDCREAGGRVAAWLRGAVAEPDGGEDQQPLDLQEATR